MRRLQEVKFPVIEFKGTSIRELIGFLKHRDIEAGPDEDVNVNGELLGTALDNKLDLTAKEISLADLLATAAEAAQCDLEIGHGTVTFRPRKEELSLAVVAKGKTFELAIANVTSQAIAYASDPRSKEGDPAIVIELWKGDKWEKQPTERPPAEPQSAGLEAKHKVYRKVDLAPILESKAPFRISLQFSPGGEGVEGRREASTVYSPNYYFMEGWLMNAGPLQ